MRTSGRCSATSRESKRLLGVMETHLAGRQWFMDDEYTIADISMLGWVRNLIGFYGARELVGFDEFKNVAAWLERGLARPAVQRGLEHSEAAVDHQRREQFVDHGIVGAGAKAAFQQRRDHVERGERDHKPDRDRCEQVGRVEFRRAFRFELPVEQQHGGYQHDGGGKADQGQGVIMIAKQRGAVTGVAWHDVQEHLARRKGKARGRGQ